MDRFCGGSPFLPVFAAGDFSPCFSMLVIAGGARVAVMVAAVLACALQLRVARRSPIRPDATSHIAGTVAAARPPAPCVVLQ